MVNGSIKNKLPTLNVGLFEGHCFYIKDMSVVSEVGMFRMWANIYRE